MVDRSDDDDAEPRNAGDPLREFAAALNNACALGSAMLGGIAAQSDLANAAAAFTPFAEFFSRATSAGDRGVPGGTAIGQEMTDMAGFLAQTWMVAAASGFRYWRRMAETYGQHQSGLMQAMATGGLSEDERRTMIDELRAYVRELGDLSLQEARLLQHELERLSFGLAASADAPVGDREHRRHWRVKP